jgi:hypothetical protein
MTVDPMNLFVGRRLASKLFLCYLLQAGALPPSRKIHPANPERKQEER